MVSRHFISDTHLQEHLKSKLHKRRLKKLEEEPYTQEEVRRIGFYFGNFKV